jgi:aspartate-semialdehyde dehydrogenase
VNADFQFREKIPVAILGATGTVGQQFVVLLANHPWFEIVALTGSERSAGKPYHEAVHWVQPTPIDPQIAHLIVSPNEPHPKVSIAFSALDTSVAGAIESSYAEAGITVISNASAHRMRDDVPLLIPDVNPDHADLLKTQTTKGKIVTNPNCTATGLTIALKPLQDKFGLKTVHVVTFQAISGAGYPGVAAYDILDNMIPHIQGEEEKLQIEPQKILGDSSIIISAQCNRAPLTDGHVECVSVTLKEKATAEELIEAWNSYRGLAQEWKLPTAPLQPINYQNGRNYPQPRLQKMQGKGMAVSIGQLKKSANFDFQFTLLSHNTMRGAAGGAVLNAELLVKKGYIYW